MQIATKKKIVFLSYHFFNSRQKAGFHHLANAADKMGLDVVFITAPVSILSFLRKDFRLRENGAVKNLLKPYLYFGGVKSIINFSWAHPVKRKFDFFDSTLGRKLFSLDHRAKVEIRKANFVIFESTPALLFFDISKKLNPDARFIYRMSDDISVLNLPACVADHENKIINLFDLVSVPCKTMYDKFSRISPQNVKLHHHGVDKAAFDKEQANPYTPGTINHVFVGNSYLDGDFIDIASGLFPGHYYHIIGAVKKNILRRNVIYYGMMPFVDTIKYIKYATTGLQVMSNVVNTAILSDSLKVLQYSFCRLPVILPNSILRTRENFFGYNYGDRNSIKEAVENASSFNRDCFNNSDIYSWNELVNTLIGMDNSL
ncbi:MAG: hypothetical protein HY808_14790 [Nitrospirae bacterium]|nr:hypothetical protein [Nitrospirota bacterium]